MTDEQKRLAILGVLLKDGGWMRSFEIDVALQWRPSTAYPVLREMREDLEARWEPVGKGAGLKKRQYRVKAGKVSALKKELKLARGE
ncbi:MAG TPA: hypothetical protein VF272_01045 [Candidatus Saccharimonadia bacterium]